MVSVFSKASGLSIIGSERSYDGVCDWVFASSYDSLFLVYSQAFTITESEKACDGVCVYLKAVEESVVFNKALCFYYKWQ